MASIYNQLRSTKNATSCYQRWRHYKTKDLRKELASTANREVYNSTTVAHLIYKIQKTRFWRFN